MSAMNSVYPHLTAPIKIKNHIFRNRIWTAPITPHALQSTEPYPTEAVITHFANKAKGGAACVTCSGVALLPEENSGAFLSYDLTVKSHLNILSQLSERIHAHGAKASMELGGFHIPGKSYGVVGGMEDMMFGGVTEEMPEEAMLTACKAYADAAEAVKTAGFDVVMLNFGHHNDMGQFLSPLSNTRTDKYGGASLEDRARFPMMLLDSVRERIGPDMLIELRISGAEFEPGGIEIEESIEFIRMIEDKIDLIHVSAGMLTPRWVAVCHPSALTEPMPNAYLAAAVKAAGVKIPVMAIGGIQDLDAAEKFMADTGVDIVTMARGIIADTDIGNKAIQGRGEDVTPCVRCMHCHDSACSNYHFRCTVNPAIGIEHCLEQITSKATSGKRVAVIGGGPAGMNAALYADRLGHEVTLFEASGSLGGQIKFTDHVDFKHDLKRYKDFLIRHVEKSGVNIVLNQPASPEEIEKLGFAAVLVAVGAEPARPPIPGRDGDNVVQAANIFGNEGIVGYMAAVIGGGQVGCETALHLARLGRRVTILEMADELCPGGDYYSYSSALILELELSGMVEILTGVTCTGINNDGVSYKTSDGEEKRVAADTVIMAAGMKGKTQEAFDYARSAEKFFAIGDCSRVASVEEAVRSAFYSAHNI